MRNILLAVGLMAALTSILFAGDAGMMRRDREDPLEGVAAPSPTLMNGNLQRVVIPRNRNTLLVFFSAADPAPLRTAERLLGEHPKARAVGFAIATPGRGGAGGNRPMPPGGGEGKGNPPRAANDGEAQFFLTGYAQGGQAGRGGGYGKQPGKGGSGAMSAQLQQLLEQLRQVQTSLPILLDATGEAMRDFRLPPGGAVLIDDTGFVRARSLRFNDDSSGRLAEQLALLGGDAPERFGWRNDITFALDVAQGRRDMQGRPIVPGKGKTMMQPPQMSARQLQMVVPPSGINLKLQWDDVPENYKAAVKESVAYALNAWSKALPEVKFTQVEERDDADLIVTFKTEVLDPRDENGVRTVCCNFRTLDEEARGKGKPVPGSARPDPRNEHRIKTVAQIGWGHLTDGVQHSQRAVAHMLAGAIGSALGLEDRRDNASVMNPNVDTGNPALTPSKTDLAIIQGLGAALNFEIGKQYLEMKRTKLAEESFGKIPKNSRYAEQAKAALLEAGVGGSANDKSSERK